jgi:hypothetical protein
LNIFKKYGVLPFIPAGILLIAGICVISLKIAISILMPDNTVRNYINNFFNVNLKKAVVFQDLSIFFNGTVNIKKIQISATGDFNDGFDFVKADSVNLNFDLISILTGEPTVDGMEILSPEISIAKRTGKTYYETLVSLFVPDQLSEGIRKQGFGLSIKDGTLNYIEYFSGRKQTIKAGDIDADFYFRNDRFRFRITAEMLPSVKDSGIPTGIKIKGSRISADVYNFKITTSDFNLSYLRAYLEKYFDFTGLMSGTADIVSVVNINRNIVSAETDMSVSDLIAAPAMTGASNYISDFDFDLSSIVKYNLSSDMFNMLDFDFSAKHLKFRLSADRTDEKLTFMASSKKINLNKISEKISPFPGYSTSGTGFFSISLLYDLIKNQPETLNAKLGLNNFSITEAEVKESGILLDETDVLFKLNKTSLESIAKGNSGRGSFNFKINSAIASWQPFSSTTAAELNSRAFEGGLVFAAIRALIMKLYHAAYESRNYGMDDEPFLQKPAGQFLQNNNFKLKFAADRILLPGKAFFENSGFLLNMDKGIFSFDEFSLSGYEGSYSLSSRGFLNNNNPSFNIECEIKDVNVGKLYSDLQLEGGISGKLSTAFKYDLTGYKLSKFLDNSKGDMKISVENLALNNTAFQKKFQNYFAVNNIPAPVMSLKSDYLSANILLLAENWYINGINLEGSDLNIYGSGRYTFSGGQDLVFKMTSKGTDGKIISTSIKAAGALSRPCFSIPMGKQPDLCFNP